MTTQAGKTANDIAIQGEQKNIIRVLLIEDSRTDVQLFKRRLGLRHNDTYFEVTDTARMKDAITLLGQKAFDIIFLDLNLPDISDVTGVAVLRMADADIPIIVYSGTDDTERRKNAFLCGAQTFLLKNKQNNTTLRAAISQALPDRMQKKILIIDDNYADRYLYMKWLSANKNYTFIEAGSAHEGFEAIATQRPDCILLDFMLNHTDGLEMLQQIKRSSVRTPPVIFITGFPSDLIKDDVLSLGTKMFLDKLCLNEQSLSEAVSKVIGNAASYAS